VLLLLAAFGTLIAFVREPVRQVAVLSMFGVLLAIFCLVLRAPDVALSVLAVQVIAEPLLVLFALAKIREDQR
jgi:uncharacterized MnhB-related membrane protein